MSSKNHPAYDSMVTAATGLLVAHRDDLERHDRTQTRDMRPRECFVWIVGSSHTHLVRATADSETRTAYRDALDPDTGSSRCVADRVYFWDGHDLQCKPHAGAFEALERHVEQLAAIDYTPPTYAGAGQGPYIRGE